MSEAGDLIATGQRFIEAGVLQRDGELIEIGKSRWRRIWPEAVVDDFSRSYIEDLEKEFGK